MAAVAPRGTHRAAPASRAHAAALSGDRDGLLLALAPPKTCTWSWWRGARKAKHQDLIDPESGDTLLHSAARAPDERCRSLLAELLSGSEQLQAIDARVVNFSLETPLHVAVSERRLAAAEARPWAASPT